MNASEDLLRLLKFEVDVYHNARVCGDWTLREHALGQSCFHLVTVGECRLNVPAHMETILQAGDLLVFPRELEHTLHSPLGARGPARHLGYAESDGVPGTGLLCAEVRFRHPASEFLLNALPPVVLLRGRDCDSWLPPLTRMLLDKSLDDSAMAAVIRDRLCELLFVYCIDHLLTSDWLNLGLLKLHADPQLARALKAIHAEPERSWNLVEMATEAAQSRTLFVNRFRALSGWTPMQYLTWWRLQLALEHLQAGDSVSQAAERVGYRSTAAFSRAFSRHFGFHAGQARRSQPGNL